MKIPSPGFLLNAFFEVCRRFPATMIAAVLGVGVVMLLIGPYHAYSEDTLARCWMACQLGLPLLTGLVVFGEERQWPVPRIWLLQAAGLLALAAYAWYLIGIPHQGFEYLHLPRFAVLLLAAHLFVAVAPYLNGRPVADFWEYNRRIFAHFIVGAAFTVILFAGLSLAILALDQLFDVHFDYRIYGRLFVLLAGVFNTAYFLFHFPQNYGFAEEDAGYNAIFRNLCKYILIPIVGLYFLILYAYGTKILATWSLPRGWVSSLVVGFSVAGIFSYLLNFYLPRYDDSGIVGAYRKWFWWVLLPLTVLLFVAIGRRIGDYGITEERFLVAHVGVWLALCCLYFLFSKTDNLKFIPVSLGLFALSFAFGPFSAFAVSERSQQGILRSVLERNGRWAGGKIQQNTAPMTEAEETQAYSALQYLEYRGHLEDADWLPMPLESLKKLVDSTAYSNTLVISKWLNINPLDNPREDGIRYLSVSVRPQPKGLELRGYERLYPVNLSTYHNDSPAPDEHRLNLSTDGRKILVQQVRDTAISSLDSLDLAPMLLQLRGKTTEYVLNLNPEDAWYELRGQQRNYRLLLSDLYIEEEKGVLRANNLGGYLLLKTK